MRLICPNCGAQYEVPDEVIPAGGRDVQCSNCGDTWFQQHPDHTLPPPRDDAFDNASPAGAAEETAHPPRPEPEDAPDPAPERQPETKPEPRPAPTEPPEAAPTEPQDAAPGTPRRGLDPDVADILRSEAERERKARNAATSSLETQPDLGLAAPAGQDDEHSRQIRARMERLRGETAAEEAVSSDDDADDIDPKSRRNLFPDIEEINSTLNAAEDRTHPDLASLPQRTEFDSPGGGFGRGFRVAVLVFVIAALVYLLAPRISTLVPGAEAPLAQYVESVNVARVWLDQSVARALGWISGASGSDQG